MGVLVIRYKNWRNSLIIPYKNWRNSYSLDHVIAQKKKLKNSKNHS